MVVDDGGVSGVELESSPCVGFSSMLCYVCSPVLPHLFFGAIKLLRGRGLVFLRCSVRCHDVMGGLL